LAFMVFDEMAIISSSSNIPSTVAIGLWERRVIWGAF
jgi:hypothetical protein